jgi:exopolysaccharide production protein ExoY
MNHRFHKSFTWRAWSSESDAVSIEKRGFFLATIPVVRQAPPDFDMTWQAVGICERLASAALFVAVSPVLAVSAVTVSLLSGRTPLIAHRRVGWRGNALWMLKLRTMWGPAAGTSQRTTRWVEYIDDQAGPHRKHPADPRVPNWFARFCRRHSIDELPQLWHVIRGEMALVGPRPATASEIRAYYGSDAETLLAVKPGIAGLWQISGRNRLTYEQRRDLDLQFVHNRSLAMYGSILLRTLPEVFRGSNSW